MLAKTGLRELLTAAALLLVVGVALLMTLVGLSPALGSFVAGVVSSKSVLVETTSGRFRASAWLARMGSTDPPGMKSNRCSVMRRAS